METKILEEIALRVKNGETCALVTVINTNGSTPAKNGSIMAVFKNKIVGTVGGGSVEHEIIENSKKALVTRQGFSFEYNMTEKNGLACGGKVTGYVKIFTPKNKLVIYGGGYVGRNVATLGKQLNFEVIVIDDREQYKDLQYFENAKYLSNTMEEATKDANIDEHTYVVIATRGHDLDKEALYNVINTNAKYIGMIGSRKKVKSVFERLENQGISKEKLEKVYAPIGLPIDDGTPTEIGFSIISQILQVKNESK